MAATPSGDDRRFSRERHIPPPAQQLRHINEASQNPVLRANFNQGRPPIAATPRAAAFTAPNIIGARGAAPLSRAQPDTRNSEGPRGNPNGSADPTVPAQREPGQDASGRRQFNDPRPYSGNGGNGNGAPNLPQTRGAAPEQSPRAQPQMQSQPQGRPAPDAPRAGPAPTQRAAPQQPNPRSQPPASPTQPQAARPQPQAQRPQPQAQPAPKAASPPPQRQRVNPDPHDPDHDRR